MSSDRFVVVWRVTERCNLGCAFCAYDRSLPFERRDAVLDRVLDFGRVLSAFERRASLPVHVSFLGGEPMLWKPLAEVETVFARELGLSLGITTNGTTLGSQSVRARLLEHYDELTVSIDALGAEHDALRSWPGAFERLRASITALRRSNSLLRIRVNAVLMRQTIATFPALCRTLAGWGIDEITFNQLGGNDRPEFFALHRLLPDQVRALAAALPALRQELAERGVALSGGAEYLARLEHSALGRRMPVLDCDPGARFLFVNEAGIASPCGFTSSEYGVSLDELRDAGDLLELGSRFTRAMRARRALACDDCPSTRVFSKFSGGNLRYVEERYGT